VFKSDREYMGLDDFFDSGSKNHIMSWDEIKKRIAKLDSLYIKWQLNYWVFDKDEKMNQFLNSEIVDVIGLMRSSSHNYIIANFEASIILSSVAVEKLCNAILFIDFIKKRQGNLIKNVDPTWIEVDTVDGPMYFDTDWNRIVEFDGDWLKFEHKTLGKYLMESVQNLGYSVNALLNPGDTIDNSIFIARRNAVAHGDPQRLIILEQMHGYVVNDVDDIMRLMNHKKASLDQYKKASTFIIAVLAKFNSEFPTLNNPKP
jgi:hypothetical protein